MVIVPIHFYLQHLNVNCLFLSNACKISRVFFNWGIVPSFKIMFYIYTQISLLYDNIGEIIVSNILQAREGFNLLKIYRYTDIQCICCGSLQSPRSCKFYFLFLGSMIMNAIEFETKNKIKLNKR